MRIWSFAVKIYLAVFCMACYFACSNGSGTVVVEEKKVPSDGDVIIDSLTGDTIRDTVRIYPDTTLRYVGNSALHITEIASLNLDWMDRDGDDPSWVEIYNSGGDTANLKGYALVENLKEPKKWVFGNEWIPPKSFRTVFCDKKDIATVYGIKDSVDADKNVLHSRTHTNWKLDKSGGTIYLVDPSNGIRDSADYPELAGGVSWGIVDGGDWKYFGTSTPERKNTDATAYDAMAPSVDLSSIKAGFYDEKGVTINPPTLESGVTLRCTKDGSAPTSSSEVFNAPMTITKNTSLRCSAFKSGTLTKEVVTRTIFVGETVQMPVVAISVDPTFLSKYYTQGLAGGTPNYNSAMYQDVEFPVHVEYFENGSSSDGSAFDVDAGLSLMGGYSRLEDKKSVGIVMREDYQDGKIHYPLFETRKETANTFRGFNLRNNGNRFVSDYLMDAMAGALLEGTEVDYQRSRQVVVFYNGKYFGIHDMRERFNKHYVETNYGIDANSVEVIKHLGHDITSNTNSTKTYTDMLDLAIKADAVSDADYATLKTMMDVGNFADYMAFEIYMHNADWPGNNVRAWRSPDHPYKFMVYDMDHGMDWMWPACNEFVTNESATGTNMFSWIAKAGCKGYGYSDTRSFANVFNHLIKNSNFKRLFINRSALLFNDYVNSARVKSILSSMASTLISDETSRDQKAFPRRWYHNACEGEFSISGSCMKTWAENRDKTFVSDYKSQFGVGDLVSVSISASGNGSVLMEGRKLPSSYTGKFFSKNTMELTAVPAAGAAFTGWSDKNKDNPRIITISDGATFTATFK